MSKPRNDIWVYVPKPGREAEAHEKLKAWLQELDGHPGYLGGSLMSDAAGELVNGAIIVNLRFDSTESARALWPKLKDHPVESDILPQYPPDQGWILFEDKKEIPLDQRLEFNRGRGLFARLLHIHAQVDFEFAAHT